MDAQEKQKILIVDDIVANIKFLIPILASQYKLFVATSGREALETVSAKPVDLILLDIVMPVMDGFEVCRLLKADAKTRDIPVIFLTAASEAEDETRGLKEGAVDFITKPINPSVVKARIKMHLDMKRMEYALRRAVEQAAAADRAKSAFLASMSHEIRTPMNAILGLTHLALRTDPNPRQRDYLEKISLSAHSLLHLINDILDLSKIEAGRLEMEAIPFDLEEVLTALVAVISQCPPDGPEILFAISPQVPQQLVGDSLRLGQILLNLINNAIKFTAHGVITLLVEVLEQTADGVLLRFSVRDTGIGMESEILEKLFQPFTQASSTTTRKYGGTGLGLTISRHLVTLMGGELTATSRPGEGSTFTFTAGFGRTAASSGFQPLPPALQGLSVLVAEGHEAARLHLQGMVRELGLTANGVASHEALLALVSGEEEEAGWDLLLLSPHLPGLQDKDAMPALRAHTKRRGMPTILVGGLTGNEAQGTEDPGCCLVDKPVIRGRLRAAILGVFGSSPIPRSCALAITAMPLCTGLPFQGVRLLLVEDNEINQQVAGELLSSWGAAVEIASNGYQALELAGRQSCDAVLMDIQMPGMDGFETTRALRQLVGWQTIPIIAMTANAMAEDRAVCLQAGMNDYITKPFEPQGLQDTLARWLDRGEVTPMPVPPAPTNLAIPDLPGIAVTAGLARVQGNVAFYRQLLGKFHDLHQGDDHLLQVALAEGDTECAVRLVHTIKAVAGMLGAEPLQQSARLLEESLRQQGLACPWEPIMDFLDLFRTTRTTIGHWLASQPATEPVAVARQAGNARQLLQALTQVRPLFQKRMPRNCLEILEPVAQLAWPEPWQQTLTEMVTLIRRYRFHEALPMLDTLSRQIGEEMTP